MSRRLALASLLLGLVHYSSCATNRIADRSKVPISCPPSPSYTNTSSSASNEDQKPYQSHDKTYKKYLHLSDIKATYYSEEKERACCSIDFQLFVKMFVDFICEKSLLPATEYLSTVVRVKEELEIGFNKLFRKTSNEDLFTTIEFSKEGTLSFMRIYPEGDEIGQCDLSLYYPLPGDDVYDIRVPNRLNVKCWKRDSGNEFICIDQHHNLSACKSKEEKEREGITNKNLDTVANPVSFLDKVSPPKGNSFIEWMITSSNHATESFSNQISTPGLARRVSKLKLLEPIIPLNLSSKDNQSSKHNLKTTNTPTNILKEKSMSLSLPSNSKRKSSIKTGKVPKESNQESETKVTDNTSNNDIKIESDKKKPQNIDTNKVVSTIESSSKNSLVDSNNNTTGSVNSKYQIPGAVDPTIALLESLYNPNLERNKTTPAITPKTKKSFRETFNSKIFS